MDSLRLRRTNIFYPTSRDIPDLRSLLRQLANENIPVSEAIVDDILEIEESRFASGLAATTGDEIESLIDVAKRTRALPPEKQRRCYFHMLRRYGLPKKLVKAELPLLLDAYEDVIAEAHRGYPAITLSRLHGLLHFGYAPGFDLDRASPPDLEELRRRRVLWQSFGFQHLPGMLSKLAKFEPYSRDAAVVARLQALLGLIRFRTSDYTGKAYPLYDFSLWGMVTIVLMDASRRGALLETLACERESLPLFNEHVDILGRIVTALGDPAVSQDLARILGN